MDSIPTTTSAVTSTPAAAPAAAPTPAPAPAAPAAPMVNMENGGFTQTANEIGNGGGNGGGFWKSLNWMEVGFAILGVASLFGVIHYYRYMLKQNKMVTNDLQRQIDELKMNVQSNLKGKYKSI